MKLLLYVFAVLWAILPSVFSQTTMPAQPSTPAVSAEIQRAMNLLSGAGWADAQKLAGEREALATALPDLIAGDMRLADMILERVASSDLLMQSIYQGLLAASDRGIDCNELLPKFFKKVSKSTDPEDIPDRSRIWVIRDAMLVNLAIRIVRSAEHREQTADEIVEIVADPSGWIKRVYPTKSGGANSLPSPINNHAKTTSPRALRGEQVAPLVQPPVSKEAPKAKPTPTKPSEEPAPSTPWSIIVVLIMAATGLLWLLLKRRS